MGTCFTRFLIAISVAGLLSCATTKDSPAPDSRAVPCSTLAGIPGPEDLVLDPWNPTPRLLVSSYHRWAHAEEGAIHAIDLTTDAVSAPFKRTGEPLPGEPGSFAFRPQGLDLWKSPKGDVLLAVVVHGDDDGRNEAVILYKVKGQTLEFVEAIRDRKWIVDPNDVAFAPDGRLYVTNFGEAGRKPWTYIFNRPASTMALCDPAKQDKRCSVVARNTGGGNGVIVHNGRPIAGSFFGSYLFDVEWSKIDGQIFLRRFARVPYPDNMTIAPDQTVLIASHAMPAVALHAQMKASAPSAIYRFDPRMDAPPRLVFQDSGETIQAASAAAWYGKKLYIGQAFGDGVVVVPLPDTGLDHVVRCELPSGGNPKSMVDSTEDPSHRTAIR